MRNEKSFSSGFNDFFLQNFNHFFIIRKLLCGLNNFIRDSGFFLLLGKIIICGNLHDHFKNWLLLNHAGLTYYFINRLLFDCAGLTKEELQESTEVNSFELWIIQFSFGGKNIFEWLILHLLIIITFIFMTYIN